MIKKQTGGYWNLDSEVLHGGGIALPVIFPVSLTKMVSVTIDLIISIHFDAKYIVCN